MTYKKLPKKFKEKWVKALRGGKYKQVIGALHKDGGFCCIGVECHLHGVSIKDMKKYPIKGGVRSDFSKVPKYMNSLIDCEVVDESPQQILISMNDEGNSFKQIANWIDKNL